MNYFEELLKRQGGILGIAYESVSLSVAALAVAGTYPTAVLKLDDTYHICNGVCFTEISNGGITNGQYKVQVVNNNGKPVKALPIQAVSVTKNDGTDPNKRFLDCFFTLRGGNSVTLEAVLAQANGASALVVEASFRLIKFAKAIDISQL